VAQTVRVEGLRERDAKLRAIAAEYGSKNVRGPVRTALRKAGNIVRDDAKRRVRVNERSNDDGIHVRDNIIVVTTKKKRLKVGEVGVDVTVRYRARDYVNNRKNRAAGRVGGKYKDFGRLFYARFLEFGTSKMRSYPFLRPAYEANKGALPGIIRDELAKAIAKTVARLRR
jgi:HK97 gp10 family phage protein